MNNFSKKIIFLGQRLVSRRTASKIPKIRTLSLVSGLTYKETFGLPLGLKNILLPLGIMKKPFFKRWSIDT